jgi:O-acetyl-ADP-ribose deacetylase
MQLSYGDSVITLIHGKIADLAVDLIVHAIGKNAGQAQLPGIYPAGEIGDPLSLEPMDQNQLSDGKLIFAPSKAIPSKYIVHLLNPICRMPDDDRKLADITQSVLTQAEEKGFKSVAFPDMASGYSLSIAERCAKVMLITVTARLRAGSSINRVIFCLQSNESYTIFQEALNQLAS